jgi:L-fuconolactonase
MDETWHRDISRLARETNAYCKLSGLFTEVVPGQTLDLIEPYLMHLLDSFGPERLMWGSDWPVLNLASNYDYWVKVCEQYLSQLDPVEEKCVWGNTAREFYGL